MTTTISTTVTTVIIALGGLVLVWWWLNRPSWPGWLKFILRLLSLALFIGLGIFITLANNRAAVTVTETPQIVVPSERLTVSNGTMTVTLNATGALTPADKETMTFSISAPVSEVLVSEGDFVKAGDPLVRVDTTTLDAQVRSAQLNLTSAQNALAALNEPASDLDIQSAKLQIQAAQASLSSASLSGPSAAEVEIARLNVELAKNSLWQAQVNRDVAESRPGAGTELNALSNDIAQAAQLASSEMNVQQSVNSYGATANEGADASGLASGNAALLSAQAKLESLLTGPTEAEVRKAEITIESAQLSLDAAKSNLEDATLVAPFDGVVAENSFIAGTMSSTGSLTLVDVSGYTITVSVDEKDIAQLTTGQTVRLQVVALDNALVSGVVTHIDPAPVASTSGQLVTYNVEVTLFSSDKPLRPGMSSIATITLEQIDGVIVVPNRFITVDGQTQQATVKLETASGVYQDVPVTLGRRTDSESVVMAGLTVGQTLVILPSASSTATQSSFGFFPGAGAAAGGGPPAGFPSGQGGGGAPPGGG